VCGGHVPVQLTTEGEDGDIAGRHLTRRSTCGLDIGRPERTAGAGKRWTLDVTLSDRTHLRREVLQILDRPLRRVALLAGRGDEVSELLGLEVEQIRDIGRRRG